VKPPSREQPCTGEEKIRKSPKRSLEFAITGFDVKS